MQPAIRQLIVTQCATARAEGRACVHNSLLRKCLQGSSPKLACQLLKCRRAAGASRQAGFKRPTASNMQPQPPDHETLLGLEQTAGSASQRGEWRPSRAKCRPNTASSMIENFTKFLASRNVINQTSVYDKIPDNHRDDAAASSSNSINHVQLTGGTTEPALWLSPVEQLASYNNFTRQQQQQQQPKPASSEPFKLLASLITCKQRNKSSAFISLLRAPAVLGALFSLALTVSLITLYTMTYHAHILSLSTYHLTGMGADEMSASASPEEVADRALTRALTVQTECGRVVGQLEDGAIAFTGIPYATPPVARRRWRRPQPVWLDASLCGQPNATIGGDTASKPAAHQGHPKDHCSQLSPFKRRITGSEDCLYLDIYSAQLDPSKKLPVMVYIHGGFLAFGSSGRAQVNWMKARPSGQLASELNVVLVAFNFRLQALGFMRPTPPGASEISADIEAANYGLWDQLVALKWVKRNIEAFGGDPNNVVLFGPDSASALPLALMSQHGNQFEEPTSTGRQIVHESSLFRAAWLTNPTVFFEPTRKSSAITRDTLANSMLDYEATNCSSMNKTDQLECLLELSAEQVIQAYLIKEDPSYRLDDQNSMPVHGVFSTQLVSIDKELVQDSFPFSPLNPLDSSAPFIGGMGGKDLLIGSSAQAVEYWPCPRNLSQWSKADLEHYTSTSLASFHPDTYKQALNMYTNLYNDTKHLSPDELARLIYLTMVTDIRQICPANLLERSLRDLGHSVRRYIVETPYKSEQISSSSMLPHHAFHYWDLIAFFGFQFDERFKPNPADLKFQANIRSMVRRFVHRALDNETGNGHILFSKDASMSHETFQRRHEECNMWQSQLGHWYSWTS